MSVLAVGVGSAPTERTPRGPAHPSRVRPTVRRAPALDPPFDAEAGPVLRLLPGGAQVLPFEDLPPSTPLFAVVDDQFGPQPTPRAQLPAPRPWAASLLQAVTEVLAGHRPATQLQGRVSEAVRRDVTRAARTHRTPNVRVSSVHVDEPADGVVEVCAVVRWQHGSDPRRAGALAARLEGIDGRWRCTVLRWI